MVKPTATRQQQQMQHGNKSNIPDPRAVYFYLFYPSRTCGIRNRYNRKIVIVIDRCTKNRATDTIRSDIIIFSTVRGFYYCL